MHVTYDGRDRDHQHFVVVVEGRDAAHTLPGHEVQRDEVEHGDEGAVGRREGNVDQERQVGGDLQETDEDLQLESVMTQPSSTEIESGMSVRAQRAIQTRKRKRLTLGSACGWTRRSESRLRQLASRLVPLCITIGNRNTSISKCIAICSSRRGWYLQREVPC